jgi:hypothetical protein
MFTRQIQRENRQEQRFLCLISGVEEGDNGGQLLGAPDDGQPPLVQAQAHPLQQRRGSLPIHTGHRFQSINRLTNQSINIPSETFHFCTVKATSRAVFRIPVLIKYGMWLSVEIYGP